MDPDWTQLADAFPSEGEALRRLSANRVFCALARAFATFDSEIMTFEQAPRAAAWRLDDLRQRRGALLDLMTPWVTAAARANRTTFSI